MPSLFTYTPFESLLLFQSIARHGTDEAAFSEISASLKSNQFIRDDENYDGDRLTVDALQGLYEELVRTERGTLKQDINGSLSNSRKRKLSLSPAPSDVTSEEQLVQSLIDRLYAQYREQIVRDIREDEEAVQTGQKEVQALEPTPDLTKENIEQDDLAGNAVNVPQPGSLGAGTPQDHDTGVQTATPPSSDRHSRDEPRATPNRPDLTISSSAGDDIRQSSLHDSNHSHHASLSDQSLPRDSPDSQQGRRPQQPPPLQPLDPTYQHSSPRAFMNRQLPPPSPQYPVYVSTPPQHGFPHGPTPHPVSMVGPPPMHHPIEMTGAHRRTASGSAPGRGSPLSMTNVQSYQQYPQYQYQQQPWTGHPQHHQQYPQQVSPYVAHPYYPPYQGGPHTPGSQPPMQPQYPFYPQSAPGAHINSGPPAWQSPGVNSPGYMTGHPLPRPASANLTPMHRREAHRSVTRRSGSSTPWKRRKLDQGSLRPPSPTRPDREVSPLSDNEAPNEASMSGKEDGGKSIKAQRTARRTQGLHRSTRRTRAGSAGSSAMAQSSRSQSIASSVSVSNLERQPITRRGRTVKPEPPSTPAPFSSDFEHQTPQASTALRRTRGRGNTTTNIVPDLVITGRANTSKRKRETTVPDLDAVPSSPSPSLPTPVYQRPHIPQLDPLLVMISRNFQRKTTQLLNDINAHKHAGIFAKPLSEREAPGYKDLVLRPQDLKSIRTAVTRGNRAANLAIDELESRAEADEDATDELGLLVKGNSSGVFHVKKTDDLIPPKAIVNAAQLEVEMLRMFANAVMFNPLPRLERGFGPRLRLTRNGQNMGEMDDDGDNNDVVAGIAAAAGAATASTTAAAEALLAKGYASSAAEDAAIIKDTLEMYADVDDAVATWRSLGQGAVGLPDDAAVPPKSSAGAGVDAAVRAASVSVSVSSAMPDEDDGPAVVRKRRKATTAATAIAGDV